MKLATPTWLLVSAFSILLVGCFGGPKPVPAPEWDPEAMANTAMASDTNGDGALDEEELKALPGLEASMRALDTNGDKKAQKDEIVARLQLYTDTRTGARPLRLRFLRKGRPVANAKIKMVPEPFLNNIIEVAEGTTDPNGEAMMGIPGVFTDVMRVGFYRIEVTTDDGKIPAKYNTSTKLGFEVSPVSDGFMPNTTFELK